MKRVFAQLYRSVIDQQEVDFLHAWAVVYATFFRYIIVSIRGRRLSNRRHIFGKRTHFQSSCITQNRLCLSSVITGYRWVGGGGGGRGGLNALQIGPIKDAISRKKKNIFICIINVQTRPIDKTHNATTRYSLSHTDSRKLFKAAFSFFV